MDAVEDLVPAVFLGIAAGFVGLDGETLEGGGEDLVVRGVRQEVAGELPCDEVVVGEIVIEGADDPVAPWPDGGVGVFVAAVGIGEAGGVEPVGGHAFAEGRGIEELVDEGAAGGGGGIGDEGGGGGGFGRETC